MTSHTLRHYFISQCVMSGIPFFTIAKWVGHRNTKMIEETYGHLAPAYQAAQMLKLRILPVEEPASSLAAEGGQTPNVQDAAGSCRMQLVPLVCGKLPEKLPEGLEAEIGKVVTRWLGRR